MYKGKKICVVIPAYKVSRHISSVVSGIPKYVDNVIIIDDCCPEQSHKSVTKTKRIQIINHQSNQGVGAAVISGYRQAIKNNFDVVVKVDGDGQMDPENICLLLDQIIDKGYDYSKGNRFNDLSLLKNMPIARLLGNSLLSFLVKFASGFWNIMDPTNGFVAISNRALNILNLDKISKRYFFESDMLINLNIYNCPVVDVPMKPIYKNEKSSLSISKSIFEFPFKLLKGLIKRILYKYFLFDFNMASIYMLFGIPMLVFGTIFGLYIWYISGINNIETPLGTIMLSAINVILGMQFLLQALAIDIANIPKVKDDHRE